MKKELNLVFEDDGEFYMGFRDFLKYFSLIEICHLNPEDDDHLGYRLPGELERLRAECPIERLKRRLVAAGVHDDRREADLRAVVRAEIDQAFEVARAAPEPKPPCEGMAAGG